MERFNWFPNARIFGDIELQCDRFEHLTWMSIILVQAEFIDLSLRIVQWLSIGYFKIQLIHLAPFKYFDCRKFRCHANQYNKLGENDCCSSNLIEQRGVVWHPPKFNAWIKLKGTHLYIERWIDLVSIKV